MRQIAFVFYVLLCTCIVGCTVPRVAAYPYLKSINRVETKPKGVFGGAEIISISDFRGIERYDEDIEALKEKAEKYISSHADLSENTKNNLRALKVAAGDTKGEVELLLGKPDKVIEPSAKNQSTSEVWIYRSRKLNAITLFIFPVGATHESYYLYFDGDTLTLIEKHYLEQFLESASPPDISDIKK